MRFAERHFELVDFGLVILASSAVFIAGHVIDHDVTLLDILKGNRAPVYGTLAALFGTMFGFAMTAISIILAFGQSPKLSILRNSRHWRTMWGIFTRGLRILISAAIVAVLALTFDKDSRPLVLVTYGTMFAVFLGFAKLCRIIWAFQNLIFVMTQPERQTDRWRQDLATLEEPTHVR